MENVSGENSARKTRSASAAEAAAAMTATEIDDIAPEDSTSQAGQGSCVSNSSSITTRRLKMIAKKAEIQSRQKFEAERQALELEEMKLKRNQELEEVEMRRTRESEEMKLKRNRELEEVEMRRSRELEEMKLRRNRELDEMKLQRRRQQLEERAELAAVEAEEAMLRQIENPVDDEDAEVQFSRRVSSVVRRSPTEVTDLQRRQPQLEERSDLVAVATEEAMLLDIENPVDNEDHEIQFNRHVSSVMRRSPTEVMEAGVNTH